MKRNSNVLMSNDNIMDVNSTQTYVNMSHISNTQKTAGGMDLKNKKPSDPSQQCAVKHLILYSVFSFSLAPACHHYNRGSTAHNCLTGYCKAVMPLAGTRLTPSRRSPSSSTKAID